MTDALVVGCGSIGSRHVGNLLDAGLSVTACDLDADQLAAVADEHDVETTTDYEAELATGPDCVFVCTPPTSHVDIAVDALDAGADVFVEKPVANSVEAAGPLVERAGTTDSVVYVACNMRFHPPVRCLQEWLKEGAIGDVEFVRLRFGNALPNWRPGDYRDYYSASADEGGGVVLDAIHELDIADHWIDGTESVLAVADKLSTLEIDTEDTAEVLLRGDGRLAEVHLDYLRPVRARTYELIGSQGIARWHAEGKCPESSRVTLHNADGDLVAAHEFELNLNEMYVNQLEHFLECVAGDADLPVDAARGARLVRLAQTAKRASDRGETQRFE